MKLNLRNPNTRVADAKALQLTYGIRSTMWTLDRLRAWAEKHSRKVMILLSYDVPTVITYLQNGKRGDHDMLDSLDSHTISYVMTLSRQEKNTKQ